MKLLRHLAGYLPVQIASGIAAFGGVYVFTRLLGPEEYGRYALMLSVIAAGILALSHVMDKRGSADRPDLDGE